MLFTAPHPIGALIICSLLLFSPTLTLHLIRYFSYLLGLVIFSACHGTGNSLSAVLENRWFLFISLQSNSLKMRFIGVPETYLSLAVDFKNCRWNYGSLLPYITVSTFRTYKMYILGVEGFRVAGFAFNRCRPVASLSLAFHNFNITLKAI